MGFARCRADPLATADEAPLKAVAPCCNTLRKKFVLGFFDIA